MLHVSKTLNRYWSLQTVHTKSAIRVTECMASSHDSADLSVTRRREKGLAAQRVTCHTIKKEWRFSHEPWTFFYRRQISLSFHVFPLHPSLFPPTLCPFPLLIPDLPFFFFPFPISHSPLLTFFPSTHFPISAARKPAFWRQKTDSRIKIFHSICRSI